MSFSSHIRFMLFLARRSYENVYSHFLKVLPVLPCKWKPTWRKSRNLSYQKRKTNLPKFVMSRALEAKHIPSNAFYYHLLPPDFQTFHRACDKGTIRLCKWFGFIGKQFSCSWKLWLQANYPSFCSCWGPPPHFSSYFNVALILKEPIKNRRALICLWSFAHFIVVNYNVCLNCVCVPWILSKQFWRAKVVVLY